MILPGCNFVDIKHRSIFNCLSPVIVKSQDEQIKIIPNGTFYNRQTIESSKTPFIIIQKDNNYSTSLISNDLITQSVKEKLKLYTLFSRETILLRFR